MGQLRVLLATCPCTPVWYNLHAVPPCTVQLTFHNDSCLVQVTTQQAVVTPQYSGTQTVGEYC